jgi:hypothetical protein
MAQKQGKGGYIRRVIPRWLNKKRILIMIVIAIIVPGVGWLIDLVLLAWWFSKNNNTTVPPK